MPKVMLVEDDNNLREIYQARLQAEGYEIVSAKDGEEGLVIAKAEKPDLIIADVMMPKISGFEMLDILRNTEGLKEVKVIMLTALGQSEDEQRAKGLGADRYLVKSQVTLEDIVKASHELLSDSGAAPAAATPPAGSPPAPAAPTPSTPAADSPAPDAPAPDDTASDNSEAGEEAAADSGPSVTTIPITEPPADNPPASAPTAEPAAAAEAAKEDAESTAQEEADAESKIENFVAGATEEPTLPTGAPSEKNDKETDTAAASTTANAAAAADDKLVADAAQALIDSTKDTDQEDKSEPAPEAEEPAQAPEAEKETDKAEEEPAPKEESDSSNVPIAHKKVITPLNDKPKKDIQTLLAAEEAKEAAEAGDVPSGQAPGAPGAAPENPANPGNIAL